MADHEPWLSPFVTGALGEYLEYLHKGHSMVGWKSEVKGETIQIRRKEPFVSTLRTIESPSPSQVKLTDGKYHVQAVFWKSVQDGLALSGVQISHLTDSAAILRVVDPIVSIDCSYGTPELRLCIPKCEVVSRKRARALALSEGSLITKEADVKQKLLEFMQSSSRGRHMGTPSGSPNGSIRSQAAYSQGNASDSEDHLSQLPFQTQIDDDFRYQQPKKAVFTAGQRDRDPLLSLLKQRGQGATASRATQPKAEALPALHADAPVATKSNDIVLGFSTRSADNGSATSIHRTDIPKALAEPVSLNEVSPDTQVGQASQISYDEPKTNSLPHAIVAKKPGKNSPVAENVALSRSKETATAQLPARMVRHFGRWREEARSGRYLPRYVQKIPREQEVLLESDDSWQPPLVGRTPRPGQVPLALTERLCELADRGSSAPLGFGHRSEESSGEPDLPGPFAAPREEGPPSRTPEPESSDSEESEPTIPWSSSPPTQDRRRHLPVDSPPLFARQGKEATTEARPTERVTAVEPHSATSTTRDNLALLTQQRTHVDQDFENPPGRSIDNRTGEPAHVETSDNVVTIPTDELPSSTESAMELNVITCSYQQKPSFAGPIPTTSLRAKGVQVVRTPYVSKRPDSRLVNFSAGHAKAIEELDPTSSACVPGTYNEPAYCFVAAATSQDDPPIIQQRAEQIPGRVLLDQSGTEGSASGPQDLRIRVGLSHTDNIFESIDEERTDTLLNAAVQEEISISTQAVSETRLPASPDKTQSTEPRSAELVAERAMAQAASPDISQETRPVLEPDATSQHHHIHKDVTASNENQPHAHDATDSDGRRQIDSDTAQEKAGNPAYVTDLRDHRRKALISISKQLSMTWDSISSSPSDRPQVSIGASRRSCSPVAADDSPKQMSTPITRVSTYARIEEEPKARPSDSTSQLSAPLNVDLEPVFAKYKATYADYGGDFMAFESSCRLLNKFWKIGKDFHPFYDDVIFHHYYGFRQYLSEEAANEASRAMALHEYYYQRVPEPTHTWGIVTKSMIENLIRPPRSATPVSYSIQPLQTSKAALWPMPSKIEPVSGIQGPIPLAESPVQEVLAIQHLSQSEEAVEQWRQKVSRVPSREPEPTDVGRSAPDVASPELGTPNIDRSLLDIPVSDLPPPEVPVSVALSRDGDVEAKKRRRTLPPKFPLPSSSPVHVEPSTAPRPTKRPKLSASPFVKPPKPASDTASMTSIFPKSPALKKAQKWRKLAQSISAGARRSISLHGEREATSLNSRGGL
ncbi:hypothetical protein, variant [Exophiala xenobiotica]|uniref:Telomere replication protein EST3 n=1 Tax=Exophiala xenobiotica TaxID=348802 RepID=A0A0D2BF94_9EURO|nr:hypothetical protein, variant [Exophiala xenobiotica]KIW50876.1 hypothetical protein, variant [Exophiala xenobiotica]